MAAKQEIPKNRQYLLDTVIAQMESGTLEWRQGWDDGSAHALPRSGSSGKAYKGINRLVLYFTAKERGYEDPRWVTFNYVKNNNLSFKKNENGESLAKGAGVMVEFFRYYDKSTKKDLDFEKFGELSPEEQHDYWKKNVRRVTQQYTVFNASLVEGMEPLPPAPVRTELERQAAADCIINAWDKKQCRIHYGDMMAYYSPQKDEIHLPSYNTFLSAAEFYATALHEIGHATGHKSRLNRDQTAGFGTEGYAYEELCVEIGSMFLQLEAGTPMSESHIKNHAAYLQSWLKAIRENPDVLFDAVGDAEVITSFIMDNAAEALADMQEEVPTELKTITQEELTTILENHKRWVLEYEGSYRESDLQAKLSNTDLRGLQFQPRILVGARFAYADMRGVDLRGAILEETNFQGADLRGVNFQGCKLSACNFKNAKMEGAILDGAVLTHADFSGVDYGTGLGVLSEVQSSQTAQQSPSPAMRAMLQGAPKSQMGTGGAVAQSANSNINE